MLIYLFIFNFIAVREDRMPGGRNSGAVYNLYKVCYLLYYPFYKLNLISCILSFLQIFGLIDYF